MILGCSLHDRPPHLLLYHNYPNSPTSSGLRAHQGLEQTLTSTVSYFSFVPLVAEGGLTSPVVSSVDAAVTQPTPRHGATSRDESSMLRCAETCALTTDRACAYTSYVASLHDSSSARWSVRRFDNINRYCQHQYRCDSVTSQRWSKELPPIPPKPR